MQRPEPDPSPAQVSDQLDQIGHQAAHPVRLSTTAARLGGGPVMLAVVSTGGPTLVADGLVPLGVLLTVVTTTGTVQWLKGKRRLAALAPLSVVSVIGIIGIARVAKPDSPWARYRYDESRMAQARTRFGEPTILAPPVSSEAGAAGVSTVVAGVLGGAALGAVTSLVGGVLMAHALLASSGRPASRRVCAWLVAAAVAGQAALVVIDLPSLRTLPGAAATLVVAAGVALLPRQAARRPVRRASARRAHHQH